MTTDFSSQAMR